MNGSNVVRLRLDQWCVDSKCICIYLIRRAFYASHIKLMLRCTSRQSAEAHETHETIISRCDCTETAVVYSNIYS